METIEYFIRQLNESLIFQGWHIIVWIYAFIAGALFVLYRAKIWVDKEILHQKYEKEFRATNNVSDL